MSDDDKTAITGSSDATITTNREHSPDIGYCLKDRFILEEEIGRGGMGVVYRALDLRKQETGDREPYIAIKLISTKLKQMKESLIALQREAKKAQKLAHPNVATVYDFDRDGDEAYLCMELLQGEPLSDFIAKNPNGIPFSEALPIIQGMARGLSYAHAEKIVHSDFKPGNVFITNNGAVKILDFGIARAFTPENQVKDQTVFDPGEWDAITPAYASPEMFIRQDPDPRDDIYALGCVCYQLLTGSHPYDKMPANKVRENMLKAPSVKGLSRAANQALQKSVALNRNDRVSNVPEFLDSIVPRKRGAKKIWVALAAALLVIGGGLGAWHMKNKSAEIKVATVQGDPWRSKAMPMDRELQEKVNRLLEVAEAHASIGRYLKPPTSNAAEAYMAALKINPGNPQALEGAGAIVGAVIIKVKNAQAEGDDALAKATLEQALSVMPGQPDLESLMKQYADK